MKTNMHYGASPGVFIRARHVRHNPTKAEQFLWNHLSKHQIGYKFRRQHPIWVHIADFYCHTLKLVIEVDGDVHLTEESMLMDKEKEENFKSFVLCVMRFKNEEVLFLIDDVLSKIFEKIQELKFKF